MGPANMLGVNSHIHVTCILVLQYIVSGQHFMASRSSITVLQLLVSTALRASFYMTCDLWDTARQPIPFAQRAQNSFGSCSVLCSLRLFSMDTNLAKSPQQCVNCMALSTLNVTVYRASLRYFDRRTPGIWQSIRAQAELCQPPRQRIPGCL